MREIMFNTGRVQVLKARLKRWGTTGALRWKWPGIVRHAYSSQTRRSNMLLPDSLITQALNTISQGVLISGPDRCILSANQAFLRITGFSADEIVGRSCSFTQGPDTDPQTVAAIHAALLSKREFSGEILNYRKNGSTFWNDLTITAAYDEAGVLTHFIGIIHDVTASREAAAAHRSSEQRYRDLIENISAGVVVYGAQSEILLTNSTAASIFRTSPDDMRGRTAYSPEWQFLDEHGLPAQPSEYPENRVRAGGLAVNSLVIGVRRHGTASDKWVICNAYPVFNTSGGMAEVVVTYTDITEFKQAERALQKSEEQLRLVLQGSNDASWDLDLASGSAYYSPRWWQMVGLESDVLAPNSALWKSLVHPEDIDRVEETFRCALIENDSFEMEFRFLHKAGHFVPVLSRGFILRNQAGAPLRVSGTNTDLTRQKIAEECIYHQAFYDALTDLPNRRLLMEQLSKALLASTRSCRHGALLFIDLDNFKVLNDTLGHDIGDQLLQQVAIRLRHAVRACDSVARFGGDEFLVMLEDLSLDENEAAVIAEMIGQQILALLNQPYLLASREYLSTPSIGIALFGDSTEGTDDLLKQADLAMYQAKATGRNRLRFFDQSMQVTVDRRLAMERELRVGLEREEMVLHFQPQVDESGLIIGVEALVRWLHPVRGLIQPGVFIPVAEATGLILPLGAWVLRTACLQLKAWATSPRCRLLTLSVNVSGYQFREADFVQQVLDVIEETGADPTKLKLELTESFLVEDIEDIILKMTELKNRGIGFSLDDFGTGFSSLSYLKRLPLDQLKIDQSFVRNILTDPNDAIIAGIIITLADKLGLAVVAEGVEREGQRQFLADRGCQIYQGYLFSRPLPIKSLDAVLLDHFQSPALWAVAQCGSRTTD